MSASVAAHHDFFKQTKKNSPTHFFRNEPLFRLHQLHLIGSLSNGKGDNMIVTPTDDGLSALTTFFSSSSVDEPQLI